MLAEGALLVPLAELTRRSGRDRKTVYRWLRRYGVRTEGRGVLLSDLKAKWPPMYNALLLAQALKDKQVCPDCGGRTCIECTICDFSLGRSEA
jgi:hypothetical protein